jgi:probable rRNA maturation factor
MVAIAVFNRQRSVTVEVEALQRFAEPALAECMKVRSRASDLLSELREIDVVLVSDRRIAEIHSRFLNDGTPTDVITFQHGEIFISVETAKRQARAYRTSLAHELRLYLVHGLLHLHGYNDKTGEGAAEMKHLQERIVAKLG